MPFLWYNQIRSTFKVVLSKVVNLVVNFALKSISASESPDFSSYISLESTIARHRLAQIGIRIHSPFSCLFIWSFLCLHYWTLEIYEAECDTLKSGRFHTFKSFLHPCCIFWPELFTLDTLLGSYKYIFLEFLYFSEAFKRTQYF